MMKAPVLRILNLTKDPRSQSLITIKGSPKIASKTPRAAFRVEMNHGSVVIRSGTESKRDNRSSLSVGPQTR